MDCADLERCQKETPEKFTACVDDDCHHCADCFKHPQAADVSDSAGFAGYVVNWADAKTKKPEGEVVVLIAVRDLAEHGIVSAWWCAKDYCWVALDDAEQIDEERVDWYCKMINLPTT